MNSEKNTSVLLGVAFLIQAIASAVGVFFLSDPLMVPGDSIQTMRLISENPLQFRASILVEAITAMGIIMLGCLMYQMLKNTNKNIALVAMGFYIMEATILAASKVPAFALFQVSQQVATSGYSEGLVALANIYQETQNFVYELHMLPFALGATLFYSLFYVSRITPRWLAIWGVIAAPIALIGTVLILLGVEVPLLLFLPNLPFELTMGFWFLVKGITEV